MCATHFLLSVLFWFRVCFGCLGWSTCRRFLRVGKMKRCFLSSHAQTQKLFIHTKIAFFSNFPSFETLIFLEFSLKLFLIRISRNFSWKALFDELYCLLLLSIFFSQFRFHFLISSTKQKIKNQKLKTMHKNMNKKNQIET